MWRYFDFDRHWNVFLEEWNKPNIQDILFRDLIDYTIYPWQRGEPVWFFTPSNHWDILADQKTNIIIQEENMLTKFKNSFSNATGYSFKNKHDLYKKFQHLVYQNIRCEFFPKLNTLESLVIIGGNNAISYAMYSIATALFSLSVVTNVSDDQGHLWILLPEEKIVFDLEGYYMSTRMHDERFEISAYGTFLDNLLYWELDSESNDSVS